VRLAPSSKRRDDGHVVCAPDKFRGTLTAGDAAAALARGFRDGGFIAVELPLADGGEGTLDVLFAARGGELQEAVVTGPDGLPVAARFGLLADGVSVVEMAEASGLARVTGPNDPLTATTYGTGELIAAAARAGAREVIVGVGGSATVDGGRGALEALGWNLPNVPVVVACDVQTAYLDAPCLFGPQKGADPDGVEELERRLDRFAVELLDRTGVDVRVLPGAGAAGGLAGGLAALGAELRPGFGVVAGAVGLASKLVSAKLVVTGEGRLDATSFAGKVVGGVLSAAEAADTSVAVVAGEVAEGLELEGLEVVELAALAGSADEARRRAAELAALAAAELAGRM
jgi:glycerate kinase